MFLFISLLIVFNKFHDVLTCGYESCDLGKPGVLNVHLIPHTHDDVGWLKTVDEYYYGSRDNIQSAGVQYILDTVIRALWDNPNRKFSYVEIAYFYRWWQQQNGEIRSRVQTLVNQGRLQFLLGGWCMNDEANSHYTAIIDQMSLGLDFLNKTFGKCGRPLVSWQIDPFGHSIEQANIFSQMNFDALFISRIDYRDRIQRIKEKRMEFIQRGLFLSNDTSPSLFTHVLYDTYCTPPGFCFDDKCSDEPIMDDQTLNGYNVEKQVDNFAKYVLLQSKAYQSNHILVPMGCDFQFENAYHNFVNLDKLLFHVNRLRKDIHVLYSTPTCYTLAVNKANKNYTIKKDDFFPYASGPNSYWTGYFTSRPTLKGFERYSNNIFQICKQLHVLSQQNKTDLNRKVNFMAMKLAVLQHHDAVAGTEKQEVAYDYEQRLSDGFESCMVVINSSLSKLISKENVNYDFTTCNFINISYCSISDQMSYNKSVTILIYNPIGKPISNWNRIPVHVANGEGYRVTSSSGKEISSQLILISNKTKSIPERPQNSSANFDLVFNTQLPALGFSSFTIQKLKVPKLIHHSIVKEIKLNEMIIIENIYLKLTFVNGFLKNIYNLKSNMLINISIDLRYYKSYNGSRQNSGAYIFRPTTNESISITQAPKLEVIKGNLCTEIHQKYVDWGVVVYRIYNNSQEIELEWTVGPIPNNTGGKEVVLQYQTDLNTKNRFYTDTNGKQTASRIIDHRYDYEFNQTEPVAGNFYPINSHVFLTDFNNEKSKSLVIYVDRSEGVGAYRNGMVEIMVHRRTLFDDNFGVGEPLNELGSDGQGLIARGNHWICFDFLDTISEKIRLKDIETFNKPVIMFSKFYNQPKIEDYSALISNLPDGIHLLSLENHFNLKLEIDYQIIRVENIFESPGKTITFHLNKIFKFLLVTNIEELNLSANQYLKDVNKLNWENNSDKYQMTDHFNIMLQPGQIRTFKVNLKLM